MLFKEMSQRPPKDVLEAILNLEDNADFKTIMDYIALSGKTCAVRACYQHETIMSGKLAGGFMALSEIEELVAGAGKLLESIKAKEKPAPRNTFA